MVIFMNIEFWWRQIFAILIIHKTFHGVTRGPPNNRARSVQQVWCLLDTNKQTPIHSIYRCEKLYYYRFNRIQSLKYLRCRTLDCTYRIQDTGYEQTPRQGKYILEYTICKQLRKAILISFNNVWWKNNRNQR